MNTWLNRVLLAAQEELEKREDVEGYLLGRGIPEEMIEGLGMGVWPAEFNLELGPAPEPSFTKRHGAQGLGGPRRETSLSGSLVTPLRSARGALQGFEVRGLQEKKLTRYLLPGVGWHPIFIGLPFEMERLWAGGDIWIVEGLFDMGGLRQALPEKDLVLATLRARLTDLHVEFLRRHCRGVVNMLYDNDETGQHGMHDWRDDAGKLRWGALTRLKRVGVECRAVPYRGGKDPGEVWERFGTEGLRRALNII